MRRVLAICVLVTCLGARIFGKPLDIKDRPLEKVEYNGEVFYVPKQAKVDPFSTKVPGDEQKTDMILNKAQKEFIQEQKEEEKDGRSKRKARRDVLLRWTKIGNDVTVPYIFDSLSDTYTSYIMAAMNHWTSLTCVQFTPYSAALSQSLGHDQRLRFFQGDGCWSYVGRQSTEDMQPQDISIGTGCTELGTVAHEIGHAMGFEHEQSRPDRDDYVEVFWDNIETGMSFNFDKESIEAVMSSDVVKYDVNSVMHYGAYGFAIDTSKPTLLTKRPFDMQYIGQRGELSFYDVKLANYIYNCDEFCDPLLECANGGFVDKSCTCQCPSNWTGTLCNEASNTPQDVCEITKSDPSGEIKSPNYDSGQYSIDSACMYYIVGGPGSTITLTFETFDMEAYDTSANRCWDYVQINTDDPRYGGNKYCGSGIPDPIVAQDNIMIWFYSDEIITNKGFKVSYTIDQPSTTAPAVTTLTPTEAPIVTTNAPTEAPVVTTNAPTEAPTTSAPTEAPVVTTNAPTEAPVVTTNAPTEAPTTSAPTEAPVVTTNVPTEAPTTSAPTEAPVVTTNAPTEAPVVTTNAPTEAPTTSAPTEAPVVTTNAPTEAPVVTTEITAEPVGLSTTENLVVTTTEAALKTITSPRYPYRYSSSKKLTYRFTTDEGKRVYLMIDDMGIEEGPRGGSCPYDVLIINLGSTDSVMETRLCGTRTNVGPFVSMSNKMTLTFETDKYVELKGFKASFKSVTCGGTFDHDSGTIESLDYPNQYPNQLVCDYVIQVAPGRVVELTFKDLDIEAGPRFPCQYDCVELLQSNQAGQEETLLRLDGNRLPSYPIVSQGNQLILRFSSDKYVGGIGFSASYRALSNMEI